MKQFFFFLLFCLSISVILISCSDKVAFDAEDAERHEWMAPFVEDQELTNGYHNVDLGIIEYDIEGVKDYKPYFLKLDSIATAEKWDITSKTDKTISVVKKLNIYGDTYEDVVIHVHYNEEKRLVHFKIE